jgi:hypothetical protein
MTLLERLSERDLVRPALMMALVWGLAEAIAGLAPAFLPRFGGTWGALAGKAVVSLLVGALLAFVATRIRGRSAVGFAALAAVVDIAFVLLSAAGSGARRAILSHGMSLPSVGLLLQTTLARILTSVFFLVGLVLVARLMRVKAREEEPGFAFLGLDRGVEARLAWWGAILLAAFDLAALVGLFLPRSFSGSRGSIPASEWVTLILPAVVVAVVAYLGIRMWRAPRAAWIAVVGSDVVIAAGELLALYLVHTTATGAFAQLGVGTVALVVLAGVGVAVAPDSRTVA